MCCCLWSSTRFKALCSHRQRRLSSLRPCSTIFNTDSFHTTRSYQWLTRASTYTNEGIANMMNGSTAAWDCLVLTEGRLHAYGDCVQFIPISHTTKIFKNISTNYFLKSLVQKRTDSSFILILTRPIVEVESSNTHCSHNCDQPPWSSILRKEWSHSNREL